MAIWLGQQCIETMVKMIWKVCRYDMYEVCDDGAVPGAQISKWNRGQTTTTTIEVQMSTQAHTPLLTNTEQGHACPDYAKKGTLSLSSICMSRFAIVASVMPLSRLSLVSFCPSCLPVCPDECVYMKGVIRTCVILIWTTKRVSCSRVQGGVGCYECARVCRGCCCWRGGSVGRWW